MFFARFLVGQSGFKNTHFRTMVGSLIFLEGVLSKANFCFPLGTIMKSLAFKKKRSYLQHASFLVNEKSRKWDYGVGRKKKAKYQNFWDNAHPNSICLYFTLKHLL